MADQFEYPQFEPGTGSERIYEKDIRSDFGYGLDEGGRHFDKKSRVYQAMRKIAMKLEALGIPYALVGGLALLEHGFPRFTEDVDLLVTKDNLTRIHHELEGRGYRPVFAKSKNLRDTELGVKIEFLIAGDYPGDGKPKPVAFPVPDQVAELMDGIRVVNLPSLIELKLASGMSNSDRLKDLSDVQELVKTLGLGKDYAMSLSPYVRDKYLDLWPTQTKYVRLWRNKFLTVDAMDLNEMAQILSSAAAELTAMIVDGVKLDPDGGTAHDYAMLYTYDPDIAHKYEMHPEDEYLDADDNEDERETDQES